MCSDVNPVLLQELVAENVALKSQLKQKTEEFKLQKNIIDQEQIQKQQPFSAESVRNREKNIKICFHITLD